MAPSSVYALPTDKGIHVSEYAALYNLVWPAARAQKCHRGPSVKEEHLETLRECLGEQGCSRDLFAHNCKKQHSSQSWITSICGHQRPHFSGGSWSETPSHNHQLHNRLTIQNSTETQIHPLVWTGHRGSKGGHKDPNKTCTWVHICRAGKQFSSRTYASKKWFVFLFYWGPKKEIAQISTTHSPFPSTPFSHWHEIKPRRNSSSNFQFSLSNGSSSSRWNLWSINYRQF